MSFFIFEESKAVEISGPRLLYATGNDDVDVVLSQGFEVFFGSGLVSHQSVDLVNRTAETASARSYLRMIRNKDDFACRFARGQHNQH